MTGVVALLKQPGITSQQAVARLRRVFSSPAGHTGTLDPDAAGLLPVCLGGATRLSEYLVDRPKRYRFWIAFGTRTDTQDASGTPLQRRPAAHLRPEQVEDALGAFRGTVRQLPPMHSALKRHGQPLYKLARRGVEVDRPVREVSVYEFTLRAWRSGESPQALCEVCCSRGTYVRTLCDDLGEALGTGAHLGALLRLEAGGLDLDQAWTLPEIEAAVAEGRGSEAVIPAAQAVGFLPTVVLDPAETARVRNGIAPRPRGGLQPGPVRLLSARGDLVAVGRASPSGSLRLEKVITA